MRNKRTDKMKPPASVWRATCGTLPIGSPTDLTAISHSRPPTCTTSETLERDRCAGALGRPSTCVRRRSRTVVHIERHRRDASRWTTSCSTRAELNGLNTKPMSARRRAPTVRTGAANRYTGMSKTTFPRHPLSQTAGLINLRETAGCPVSRAIAIA